MPGNNVSGDLTHRRNGIYNVSGDLTRRRNGIYNVSEDLTHRRSGIYNVSGRSTVGYLPGNIVSRKGTHFPDYYVKSPFM